MGSNEMIIAALVVRLGGKVRIAPHELHRLGAAKIFQSMDPRDHHLVIQVDMPIEAIDAEFTVIP